MSLGNVDLSLAKSPDSAVNHGRTLIIVIILVLLAMAPSGVRYVLTLSSVIVALAAACAAIVTLLAFVHGSRSQPIDIANDVTVALILVGAVTAHLSVALLIHPTGIGRLALALVVLFLVLVAVPQITRFIYLEPAEILDAALATMRLLFVLVLVMGLAGIQPLAPLASEKPLFPFTEPSHFALTFTPFLIHGCVKSGRWGKLFWIGLGFGGAYFIQSLSLIVGTLLAALICLPLRQLILFGSIFAAAVGFLQLDYFTDRLDLSYQSGNLSSLVYVQGWDLVAESIERSMGWGIGFMQLGYLPTSVPTADLIFALVGNDLNLKDGGFTAAKLISELGIFGLVAALIYGAVSVKCCIVLRNVSLAKWRTSSAIVVAMCFVAGFSIDMFVRGLAYFSGTALLCLTGMLFLTQFGLFSFSLKSLYAPADA